MPPYEPKIINEYAKRLYTQAETVITLYTLAGILLGAFIGYMAALVLNAQIGMVPTIIIVTVISAIIGYLIGCEKAFWIRLQAQIALCQAKIEENTLKVFEILREVRMSSVPGGSGSPALSPSINKSSSGSLLPPQIYAQTAMSGTCPKCLSKLKTRATFCEDCGYKVL